jgi:hypothetical protein
VSQFLSLPARLLCTSALLPLHIVRFRTSVAVLANYTGRTHLHSHFVKGFRAKIILQVALLGTSGGLLFCILTCVKGQRAKIILQAQFGHLELQAGFCLSILTL